MNYQMYVAQIELKNGAALRRAKYLVWTTNRGRKRSLQNWLNKLSQQLDYRRIEIEPTGPEFSGMPLPKEARYG